MAYTSFRDFCVAAQLAEPDQFDQWQSDWRAERAGDAEAGTLPEFLCKRSGKTEADFLSRVAEAYDWQRVELNDVKPSAEARRRISSKIASQFRVVPISVEEGVLLVAVSDPFNSDLLNAVRFAAMGPVRFVLSSSEEIEKSYEKYYGVGAETIDELAQDEAEDEDDLELMFGDEKEIAEGDQEASIIKFVNQVSWQAHKSRATDIHFEPQEDELVIRHRIDGILHAMPLPPQLKQLQASLISRIKVMAGMNIAEKRTPQDGRYQQVIDGRVIDFRVSCLPTIYGESIVMRILDKGGLNLGLDQLGFMRDDQEVFERNAQMPDGIMLVTGPTGSGKTTTLYSCLNLLNTPNKKIITVEDPVEYILSGINQCQVNVAAGMTFSAALRAMLRQAPNIIMLGEIRDSETGTIAVNASLTGHFVFSTLHTNDAPGAITRMVDMGVKPFLVAAATRCIIAQRLVRRICPKCIIQHKLTEGEIKALRLTPEQLETAMPMIGAGCKACDGGGYKGRFGIFEVLEIDETLQRMIIDEKPVADVREYAMKNGLMKTLRMDGIIKVLSGMTTVEEVIRTTTSDEI